MMELSRATFQELTQVIHRLCGIVVGHDKMYLVRHRLEPVIRHYHLDGFEQLLQRLQARAAAPLQNAIVEAITTKETSFFRDRSLFNAIAQHVLPERVKYLEKSGGKRHRIRLWSAGSSTGQEAYSLAMLIREFIRLDPWQGVSESQFHILASDISSEAIAKGKSGSYTKAEVSRGLSEDDIRSHFHHRGDCWTLSEPVRQLVHFRRFNLLESPAELGAFDLILCRNVLIYFDQPTRQRICDGLYEILYEGGWLAVGAAESLHGLSDRMEPLKMGKVMLYRKSQVV